MKSHVHASKADCSISESDFIVVALHFVHRFLLFSFVDSGKMFSINF